ncbi:MAG: molybdopterin-dependent oxidoreductase [Deltaproteobacteria bacterium]|nr:molybdopterin-dependent oxidoreductase [Deltaproteobacteria bacterium]
MTHRVIGKRHRKYEGAAKATGRLKYADDIVLPRMGHAKILRSPHAHAKILHIDTSQADALPGVYATLVGAEIPARYGIIPWTQDEQALAVDKARYVGDGIAAVCAIDEDTANLALKKIHVVYEPLAALLDPFQALAEKNVVIHDEDPKQKQRGNAMKHVALSFGDVDAAFSTAELVVEGDYFFEGTTHAPIEPHCAIAQLDERGLLTVWSSTQVPHYLHRELARVLSLDPAHVRVIQPAIGGAFGGKSEPFDLELVVAKLAMKTGRPVKLLYTREEVFYAHRGRHPMFMKFATSVDREGRIKGVRSKILIDGGAYSSFGLVTTYYAGQLLTGPYAFETYAFDATRVYTNKPCCGPKRGHGSVQPRFAFEVQLDEVAERLSLDPIELRRRNFIGEHVTTINGQRIGSNGFLACLDAVEKASAWKERRGKLPRGRGLGVAGSMYISGTAYPIYPNEMPQSAVMLRIDRSGIASVYCGASDIGQGLESMLQYIAAEELGLPLTHVRVFASDTDLTPVDLGAYSSRGTLMAGNAALEACRHMKTRIREALAEKWNLPVKEIELAGGLAVWSRDTAKQISIAEAFQVAEARFGSLATTGGYRTEKLGGDYRGGTIGASPAYSFTAHVAEVTVDEETGVVSVEKIWIAHDCGKALAPVLVEGQMEGSAYMGAAEALMEVHGFTGKGLHRGPSLLDYKLPTSVDVPDLEALIVESHDPKGPYGAKEAGEGPLHPSIPAISNAIFDAVGIRLRSTPFSPAVVLTALRAKRSEAQQASA